MISIVVSSYNESNFAELSTSIKHTIGVSHEIIKIENKNRISINKAYNSGMKEAKNSIVVFVHEDVIFNTIGWGKKLCDIIEHDDKVGLVGVAGSYAKTQAPSPWWRNGAENNLKYIIQSNKRKEIIANYSVSANTKYEVLLIDGVFLAMHKRSGLYFDEKLDGFHNYDLAISINSYLKNLKNIITAEISITHFSIGNLDNNWVNSCDQFYSLYSDVLPIVHPQAKYMLTARDEIKNYIEFIYYCLQFKNAKAIKFWKILFLKNPFSITTFKLMLQIMANGKYYRS